jgi:glycosyltransferase involved in cell wall biosynthesis
MRVLTIVHDHPSLTTGGTELAAEALTRALSKRQGVTARLLAASTRLHDPDARPGSLGMLGEDYLLCTGRYDRFSMLRLDGETWVQSLKQVFGEVRPDVVHLHGVDRIGAEVVPAIRRLAPRARIVLTLHDYQLICPNDGLLLRAQDGGRCPGAAPPRCRQCFPAIGAARHALRREHLLALLRGVDAFVAPSAFLREQFLGWGIEPGRIVLIPNAVALAPPPQRQTRERPDRFAFFGNLAPHKGVLVLLDAAARLQRKGIDIALAIHGGFGWQDDAFRDAVRAGAAEARPVARLLGAYERRDLPALLARTDWVVVPSVWWENAPLAILEAREAGLPVIASGIGGMAELVRDGVDGLHVPPGDPHALAETMERAANNGKLHRRLSRASRPVASHAAHVDGHLDLYRSLTRREAA